METKQTAVEWLQEQLKKGVNFNPLDKDSYLNEVEKVFKQAKEMEKQQLGECWDAALDAYERRAGVWVRASEDFDEYFEDRFKSESNEE